VLFRSSRLTERPCPSCGSANPALVLTVTLSQFCSVNSTYDENYAQLLGLAPSHLFPIVQCRCGFAFALLAPSAGLLTSVYSKLITPEKGFYESHAPGWVGHQLKLASLVMGKLAQTFSSEGFLRVLDFGCGYGVIVRALNGPRVTCVGFDSNRVALAHVVPDFRVRDIETLTDDPRFHGVVLSDVLEHVIDPRQVLSLCRESLVANGILCVNVPIFSEARLKSIGRELKAGVLSTRELNPLEHLNYFSNETLRRMLLDTGFQIIEPVVDIGLRPNLSGIHRLGNAAKSALRLLRHVVKPSMASTVLAQRT